MIQPTQRWQHPLPTMYDLPSEDPEEPGLPDEFHDLQPQLLTFTCQSPHYSSETCLMASDLNLYYDSRHTNWYKRPDWFLVLGNGRVTQQQDLRLSYVIWQESVIPYLVIELLSPGTEREDLGQTLRDAHQPPTKWEVYEQILHIPYYGVYDRYENRFRGFRLEGDRYQEVLVPAGRWWFEELGLGLGQWQGAYEGVEGLWLRWYNEAGEWIPTPTERAEQAQIQAEQAQIRAEAAERQLAEEQRQNEMLRERLRAMGIDPDRL